MEEKDYYAERFGDEIRLMRLIVGISQNELARRVDKSAAWLSLIERGYIKAPYVVREQLKQAVELWSALSRLPPKRRAAAARYLRQLEELDQT